MRSKRIDDLLVEFGGNHDRVWAHTVTGALSSLLAHPELEEEERRRLAFELAAWDLRPGHGAPSVWGTHFHPLHVGDADDGSSIYRPSLKDLNADAASCWSENLKHLTSPSLKARYADLLWDLAYLYRNDKKRDFAAGRIAVDSYIETAKISSDIDAAFALERGFQISAELNDPNLIDLVSERLLALANSAELTAIGVWSMTTRCFLESRKLSEDRRAEWIAELERRLDEAAAAANGYACGVAADALLAIYRGKTGQEDRHRILRTLVTAYEAAVPKASALVAIQWLSEVVAPRLRKHDRRGRPAPPFDRTTRSPVTQRHEDRVRGDLYRSKRGRAVH